MTRTQISLTVHTRIDQTLAVLNALSNTTVFFGDLGPLCLLIYFMISHCKCANLGKEEKSIKELALIFKTSFLASVSFFKIPKMKFYPTFFGILYILVSSPFSYYFVLKY